MISESTPEAILESGAAEWNQWRQDNPSERPALAGIDLSDRDLSGVNLSELDLSDADFYGSDLSSANLKMANLERADLGDCKLVATDLYKAKLAGSFATGADLSSADLNESDLRGADLRGARLVDARIGSADLTDADLTEADLSGSVLDGAVLVGVNLTRSSIGRASLFEIRYGSFDSMVGHYFGIRGLDSCYGDALFVRDAKDRDYLDSFERSIDKRPPSFSRSWKMGVFRFWRRIGYGRGLGKPFAYAVGLALLFGVIYAFDMGFGWGLMDYSGSSESWLTPFYYSIVTYTTLGFGDITPQNWLGEIIVVVEVILGYTTLGLLLAILANRVARQS
jgi:hypothetical protein